MSLSSASAILETGIIKPTHITDFPASIFLPTIINKFNLKVKKKQNFIFYVLCFSLSVCLFVSRITHILLAGSS